MIAEAFNTGDPARDALTYQEIPSQGVIEDKQYKVEGVRGVKHDEGKPQYRLLPMKQLEGVVRVMEYGVEVYEEGDWKMVKDGYKRYLDAAVRHLAEHLAGHLRDDIPDKKGRCSNLLHIDHCIASLVLMRYFLKEESGL